MIFETIFLAVVGALGLNVMTSKTPPPPQTTITQAAPIIHSSTTIIAQPNNTDTGTMHNVYTVSIGTNATPQSEPLTAYESAQQYVHKTFRSLHLRDIGSAMYAYCAQNKYYLAAASALATYGYLFYTIRSIRSYLDKESTWNSWKRDIPFDQLLAIPQDELTHELITAIQIRYISEENPTDSLTPLIIFSTEIAQEKALLGKYHTYISWGMRCSLQKIISIPSDLLAHIAERKQRATYLSTIFQTWLANYKLEQVKHGRSTSELYTILRRINLNV